MTSSIHDKHSIASFRKFGVEEVEVRLCCGVGAGITSKHLGTIAGRVFLREYVKNLVSVKEEVRSKMYQIA
jgi:hypothetical protein